MPSFGLRTLGELGRSQETEPPRPSRYRAVGRRRGPALGALVDETVGLFRELRRAVMEIHAEGLLSGGQRKVLAELERMGPRTVPQMARAQSVSRQNVQSHVNELVAEGLVETIENPEHRRSRLVRITAEGGRRLHEMNRVETQFFDALEIEADAGHIEMATEVLQGVRNALRIPRVGK